MPGQWLSSPIDNLKTLLADSAGVRTFLGAASVAEALGMIYPHQASPKPLRITTSTTGGAGAASIEVAGDVTGLLVDGQPLLIRDSTGNDGLFRVRTGSAFDGDFTTINLVEALTDDADDGRVQLQHLPRIIIGMNDGRSQVRTSAGSWVDVGTAVLWMMLEQETPATYWDPATGIDDPSGAGQAFLGQIETIADELKAAQGVAGALHFDTITAETEPMQGDPDDNYGRAYWWMALSVQTGVGGG